jgi:hypothetical protein
MPHTDELLKDAPVQILRLPRDVRGYPVPWFVKWYGDRPDFRVIGEQKFGRAIAGGRCWLCGERLGRYLTFVVGPMCTVNRISSEPPSHRDCAMYAVTHCPFLTIPKMHRQDHDMPEHRPAPGTMIEHNPGVCAVWITREFEIASIAGGRLIEMGEPTEVLWFHEGRPATRVEVLAAMDKGLPALVALCKNPKDRVDLDDMARKAARFIPKEEAA